jgi:hypothetical protein
MLELLPDVFFLRLLKTRETFRLFRTDFIVFFFPLLPAAMCQLRNSIAFSMFECREQKVRGEEGKNRQGCEMMSG